MTTLTAEIAEHAEIHVVLRALGALGGFTS
jgi:hypothetical protein